MEIPDFRRIVRNLDDAAAVIEEKIFKPKGFYFAQFGPLSLTPEKHYSAKTVIPVHQRTNRDKVGEIAAILFAPGDGTGRADVTYPSWLKLDPEYRAFEGKECILPRIKECAMELFIPFFTVNGSSIYHGLTSLDEVTVDDAEKPRKIIRLCKLGSDQARYETVLSKPPYKTGHLSDNARKLQLTTGYMRSGERVGDRHAVVFNSTGTGKLNVQMGGFLAIDDTENPLARTFDDAAVPEFG